MQGILAWADLQLQNSSFRFRQIEYQKYEMYCKTFKQHCKIYKT